MAGTLDILVWDDDFKRVRELYQKYPTAHIRKAISCDDFKDSLQENPTLVILGQQNESTAKEIKETLETILTAGTSVLIWFVSPISKEILKEVKEIDNLIVSGFSFENRYLWISTYNILKTNR